MFSQKKKTNLEKGDDGEYDLQNNRPDNYKAPVRPNNEK